LGDVSGRPVIEIGPGRGILTAVLLERGARVLGIELDRQLVDYLTTRFGPGAGLELVQGDVLKLDLTELTRRSGLEPPFRVVGNIPYGITSPLLRKLLGVPGQVGTTVLMLQREVAQRLMAERGTAEYGSLTVGVRAVATVTPVLTLSPSKFRPPPRVWSTVVQVEPLPDALSAEDRGLLENLTKTLFSGRRKQLQKILRQSGLAGPEELDALEGELGTPLRVRPQELPVDGYLALLAFLKRRGYGRASFPHTGAC
jgi:16S rRNA (adenine1518-N6/adenine1519-N6)-dimethyltransferase